MAKQVLIIEDDESISRIIGEVCVELGAEAVSAKSGADGLAKFRQPPPAVVVLDILLPGGMDGIKVAEELRGRPGGDKTPIVVTSGFMKEPRAQRDLQARLGLKAFLPKPFRADDLRAVLAPLLGVDARAVSSPALIAAPPAPPETRSTTDSFGTTLQQWPAAALFAELYRGKAEGVLDLARGQAKKRFYLQRGFFRYATSNVRSETLAGLLAARGVKESRINDALAHAKSGGKALTDALVELNIIAPRDIGPLLVAQTEEIAATALAWTDGEVTFRAGTVDSGPEGRANPMLCALKGYKRLATPEQARAALAPRRDQLLERTPELERELFAIRNLFAGETLTPAINGKQSLGEVLARAKDADLVLLHALVATGLARPRGEAAPTLPLAGARPITQPPRPVSQPPRPASQSIPPAPPRPASGAVRRFTPEEEAARQLILDQGRRLAEAATHYQVLGVPPNADIAAIKAAYLRLARAYHVDAFSGLHLGDAQAVLEDIFKRASEAHILLTNPDSRAEYDLLLDRKAKGLPTDVGEILKAESAFTRAEAAQAAGRLRDAEKLYREAVTLNPGEASYLATLAKVTIQLQGKAGAREALELLDKALQLRQDFLPALLLRAQLLLDAGEAGSALELLRRIVSINPNYENALELLRHAKSQLAPGAGAEKGGLLGRLFGGKAK